MASKNFIIVSIILAIVAIVSLVSYIPARTDITSKVKVSDFPLRVGDWQGKDLTIAEQDYAILETRNLFVREYKNKKGDSVHLYLIYSEDNRKVSHPPEVCFLGSGMTITDKSQTEVADSIKVVKLLVEKSNVREMVVYWFKAGNLYTDNYLSQQLKVVLDRLLRKRTAGALIRVSAVIKDDDEKSAMRSISEFSEEIIPLLAKYVP